MQLETYIRNKIHLETRVLSNKNELGNICFSFETWLKTLLWNFMHLEISNLFGKQNPINKLQRTFPS